MPLLIEMLCFGRCQNAEYQSTAFRQKYGLLIFRGNSTYSVPPSSHHIPIFPPKRSADQPKNPVIATDFTRQLFNQSIFGPWFEVAKEICHKSGYESMPRSSSAASCKQN